jgi:hypothetical protein
MNDITTEFQDERAHTWDTREVTLYRGEEIVDFGTIKELAERRKVSKDYIYWLTTPTAARRAEKSKNPQSRLVGVVTS